MYDVGVYLCTDAYLRACVIQFAGMVQEKDKDKAGEIDISLRVEKLGM